MATKETEKTEKKTIVKKNGGRRAGSGAKKGVTPMAVVIAREARQIELADVQVSIKNVARKLINSQTVTALGTWQMATVSRGEDGRLKYVRVIDEKEIQLLLDEGRHGIDYIILAGQDPDWKAASDMLNRAGLKPKDDVDPSKSNVNIFNLIAVKEKQHGNTG